MRRILFILGLCAAVFAGWVIMSAFSPKEPPLPKVTAAGVNVPVVLGSYSWKWPGGAVAADAPAPTTIMRDRTATTVPAGAVAQIKFSDSPDHLEFRDWTSGKPVQVQSGKEELKMPDQPGIYIFEILATWKKGHGSFAFKVDVK